LCKYTLYENAQHTLFAFYLWLWSFLDFHKTALQSLIKKSEPVVKEKASTDGLKKISSGSARDWDFDIHIDHAALGKKY